MKIESVMWKIHEISRRDSYEAMALSLAACTQAKIWDIVYKTLRTVESEIDSRLTLEILRFKK